MYSLLFLILLTGVASQNLSESDQDFTGNKQAALVRLTEKDVTLVSAKILVMLDLVPPVDINNALLQAQLLLSAADTRNKKYVHGNIFQLRIKSVNETIFHAQNTFKMFPSKISRSKRAWFDAIGNFLKLATGVATEHDLDLLREEVSESQQLSLTKLKLNQNVLMTSIASLTKASILQRNLLLIEKNRNTLWQRISNSINLASDLTNVASTLTLQYRILTEQLERGIIPNLVKDQSNLQTIFEETVKKFPNLTLDPNLVSIKGTSINFKYVLVYPVVGVDRYNLYEILPWPFKSGTNMLLVSNAEKYIGISETNYFTSPVIPSCENSGNVTVCSTDLKIYDNLYSTCSRDLLLNIAKLNSSCDFHKYLNTKFHIIKSSGSYVISFFEPTDIIVTCSDRKIFKRIEGYVILNPPCVLKSDLVFVSTDIHFRMRTMNSIFSWNKFHIIDLSFNSNFTVPEVMEDDFVKLNETLNKVVKISKENLTRLHTSSQNLQKHVHVSNFINFSLSAFALLIIIFVSIAFIVFICKMRYKVKNQECCVHSSYELKQRLNSKE